MRTLYEQSGIFRWTVAILFIGALLALVGAATLGTATLFGLGVDSSVQLAFALGVHLVLLLPLWMLIAGFLSAPLLRQLGVLEYYSPFLIVSRSRTGGINLHGATPFDYILRLRWSDRGRVAVRATLCWYIDGLISLIRKFESGQIPMDTEIAGTSYFFSESSARRYGFTIHSASRYIIGGLLTFPTQCMTYSFSKGYWALPPITHAKKATISGATLCAQVDRLNRVRTHLRGKVEPQSINTTPNKTVVATGYRSESK